MPKIFNAAVLVFCCSVTCISQVTEQESKVTAEKAARAAADYAESKPLRSIRREDLEDELFRAQVKVRGRIGKAAYFYQISGEGYFVLSPDEAVYVDSTDGHLSQLVAVSAKTGRAYLLYGFKDAASEFNRLAADADIRVSSPEDAKAYTRFYFTVTADPLSERLMSSPLQLRHKVEDYFYSNYPQKQADGLYRKWVSGFFSAGRNVSFDTSASKNDAGYEVELLTVNRSTERRPLADLWKLQVTSDGACTVKSILTVYPAGRGTNGVDNKAARLRP